MITDTRKIQIIEAVLKTEDENILSEVEKLIQKPADKKKPSAFDFVGILNKEDAEAINKAIDEGCEQINPDDWK